MATALVGGDDAATMEFILEWLKTKNHAVVEKVARQEFSKLAAADKNPPDKNNRLTKALESLAQSASQSDLSVDSREFGNTSTDVLAEKYMRAGATSKGASVEDPNVAEELDCTVDQLLARDAAPPPPPSVAPPLSPRSAWQSAISSGGRASDELRDFAVRQIMPDDFSDDEDPGYRFLPVHTEDARVYREASNGPADHHHAPHHDHHHQHHDHHPPAPHHDHHAPHHQDHHHPLPNHHDHHEAVTHEVYDVLVPPTRTTTIGLGETGSARSTGSFCSTDPQLHEGTGTTQAATDNASSGSVDEQYCSMPHIAETAGATERAPPVVVEAWPEVTVVAATNVLLGSDAVTPILPRRPNAGATASSGHLEAPGAGSTLPSTISTMGTDYTSDSSTAGTSTMASEVKTDALLTEDSTGGAILREAKEAKDKEVRDKDKTTTVPVEDVAEKKGEEAAEQAAEGEAEDGEEEDGEDGAFGEDEDDEEGEEEDEGEYTYYAPDGTPLPTAEDIVADPGGAMEAAMAIAHAAQDAGDQVVADAAFAIASEAYRRLQLAQGAAAAGGEAARAGDEQYGEAGEGSMYAEDEYGDGEEEEDGEDGFRAEELARRYPNGELLADHDSAPPPASALGAVTEGEEAVVTHQADGRQYGFETDRFGTFHLKVIYEKNKTGFEATKDFPIRINDVIANRYSIVEYLGSAAFSRVVQCMDLLTGEMVCVKIIKNSKDFFDQSLDEIKLLHFMQERMPTDENIRIVRLQDYFYHREHLFIVFELLKDNLYEFSKYNRSTGMESYFNLKRLQCISRQLLHTLGFIHSLGLLHCDLKPENVCFQSYSKCLVKLIDFGSSCFTGDNPGSYIQSRSYRAPEVILDLPYDQRIDIWSLGCIVAELYTGVVLFQNDSVATLLARIIGVCGPFPKHMIEHGRNVPKFFTANHHILYDDRPAERGGLVYVYPKATSLHHRLGRCTDMLFLHFLSCLLEPDPKRRPTAAEALQHPWLQVEYGYDINIPII